MIKVSEKVMGNGTSYNENNKKTYSFSRSLASHPELPRFLISFIYYVIFGLLNAFIVIIVHDWIVKMEAKPLPDLVLDNLPFFPWAFQISEIIAIILFFSFLILVYLHKYRLVILRRLFIIYGTVLMLRCLSLLFTSLPKVSGHLQCDQMFNDSLWSKFKRGGDVFLKLGMSTRGVKTCGDYMFSGHTVALSLLNLFLVEYTPFRLLHLLSWILCFSGMGLIALGHAHYTIDIFIAFFLTTIYFKYYHSVVYKYKSTEDFKKSIYEKKYFCCRKLTKIKKNNTSNLNLNKNEKESIDIYEAINQNQITVSTSPSQLYYNLCITESRNFIWIPFYSYLEKGTAGGPLPHHYEAPAEILLKMTRQVKHRVVYAKSRIV